MTGAYLVPSFGGVVNVTIDQMPNDPAKAVPYTINKMRRYASQDSSSPILQAAVRDACSARGSVVDLCRSIYTWARTHVRFELDDVKSEGAGFGQGNEVLVRPVDLLRMPDPSEDCDGFSMLVVSMLLAARRMFGVDLRPSFCTLATQAQAPTEFTHVYVWVDVPGAGFAMDASHGPVFGWEQPNRFNKRKLWPVGESMFQNVQAPARLGSRRAPVFQRARRLGDGEDVVQPGDLALMDAQYGITGPPPTITDTTAGFTYQLSPSGNYFPSLSSNAGSSSGTPSWISQLIPALTNAGTVLGVSALGPAGARVSTNAAGALGLSLPSNVGQTVASLVPVLVFGGLAVVVIKALK